MEQMKIAAALNRVAVAKLHQGCASEALIFLRRATRILTPNARASDGTVLPATKHLSSSKIGDLKRTWTINIIFDSETVGSPSDDSRFVADLFQSTVNIVAMVHPGQQSSTSSGYFRVFIDSFDKFQIRDATTALSAILLRHVAVAYQQLGMTRNCRHCFSQALEKYEMTQILLVSFFHKSFPNHFHAASAWFRELGQISGHEAGQLYSVVFGLAPAA
jgi:hypothetical protein